MCHESVIIHEILLFFVTICGKLYTIENYAKEENNMEVLLRGIRRLRVRFFERPSTRSVRNGLVMILPILLIGSFVTLLQSIPIAAYKDFLQEFGNGIFSTVLTWANNATFGIMSIYLVVAISYCYIQELVKDSGRWMGPVVASLASFAILSGILTEGFSMGMLGGSGMFTAIISALLATKLYYKFECIIGVKIRLYADGMDAGFSNAWSGIPPFLFVTAVMLLINVFAIHVCKMASLQDIFRAFCDTIFQSMGNVNNFLGGLLYVAIMTVLWFFGIHGSNMLYSVTTDFMTPATIANSEAVAAGEVPTQILTNNFFDFFVNIGGSGACICLALAVLLFSKRKGNRRLAVVSLPTVLFNISELVVFGIPVVFNPIMFIPFVMAPIVTYIISYVAFALGIVPVICDYTVWAMPVFASGYLSADSVSGVLLQVVNICAGTMVYYPFIKILDRQGQNRAMEDMDYLIQTLKESEVYHKATTLIYLPGTVGMLAKSLGNDLKKAILSGQVNMYYQPQFDNEERCIGAEALLRWKHPSFGMIYPPLVIKLAEELNILLDLEKYVYESVAQNMETIHERFGDGIKVCVNVSATTLTNPEFKTFLKELVSKYNIKRNSICIEVNEQTTLMMDDETVELFAYFKELGLCNAIDDFSMGHTSLKCLQTGQFDVVKLDGGLVKGMSASQRNQNIIESILHLSKSLEFDVLAEFVETREQQKELEEIGCIKYQGYLYSPAVPIAEFLEMAKQKEK